ncbi:MAG TPA: hypothetical protein VHH73_03240, partial [Verrucomicrobiae bacterium]|nr:hypothetical protein [Verrucomicrobiae bacterium]
QQWTSSGGGSVLTQKRSDQWSPDNGATTPYANGINLTQGKQYYIEGVHHEGGGGDDFSVTYKLASDADPLDGDVTKLTSDVIGHYEAPTGGGGNDPAKITVTSVTSTSITVSWAPSGGTLQSTTALNGTATVWTDVGTSNPATVTIGAGAKFLRVKN